MSQTRVRSAAESVANVVIGSAVNFALQLAVFPLLGWSPAVHVNIAITLIFTATSLVRSYAIRRWFNR